MGHFRERRLQATDELIAPWRIRYIRCRSLRARNWVCHSGRRAQQRADRETAATSVRSECSAQCHGRRSPDPPTSRKVQDGTRTTTCFAAHGRSSDCADSASPLHDGRARDPRTASARPNALTHNEDGDNAWSLRTRTTQARDACGHVCPTHKKAPAIAGWGFRVVLRGGRPGTRGAETGRLRCRSSADPSVDRRSGCVVAARGFTCRKPSGFPRRPSRRPCPRP